MSLRRWLVLGWVLAVLGVSSPVLAQPAHPIDTRGELETLRSDPRFQFCKAPKRPLRDRDLCSIAAEVKDCDGFAAACGEPIAVKAKESTGAFTELLASLGRALIWVLIAAVIVAIAYPLLQALRRAQRNRELADKKIDPGVAVAVASKTADELPPISDAEAALRDADEFARRGELARALGLYLAASLAALDRRGAIRVARHRTNGEYVRACSEPSAQQPLREIVREVDKVEFGQLAPTGESVARVAQRANAVVRAAGLLTLLVLVMGCGGKHSSGPAATDPDGDELPMELLQHSGFNVSYLPTSLAALPMPSRLVTAPIVVVDTTQVTLEAEAEAHLLHWVDEGGILLLLGPPRDWPSELHATETRVTGRNFDIGSGEFLVRGAVAAEPRGLDWPDAKPIARMGRTVIAAHADQGRGAIIGITGHELFTNVGVAIPTNAEALVSLLHVAAKDQVRRSPLPGGADTSPLQRVEVQVARGRDGIPPPTNPFAALSQSGLGKGAWHALAASLVLFLAYGIRQSRARPSTPPARRAFAEHVEATGAFYGRARALGHALAAYGRFAELRIRDRLPPGGDPVAFLAARGEIPHAEAQRLWDRATGPAGDEATRGDELATIRDLRALLARIITTKR